MGVQKRITTNTESKKDSKRNKKKKKEKSGNQNGGFIGSVTSYLEEMDKKVELKANVQLIKVTKNYKR